MPTLLNLSFDLIYKRAAARDVGLADTWLLRRLRLPGLHERGLYPAVLGRDRGVEYLSNTLLWNKLFCLDLWHHCQWLECDLMLT